MVGVNCLGAALWQAAKRGWDGDDRIGQEAGIVWARRSGPPADRVRQARLLARFRGPRSRGCLGGVSVCFSERSRCGRTHRWMPSVRQRRIPGRTVAGGSQLWRAGFRPVRLSPGRPGNPSAARRSARSSTPSTPPDCPAAAAASRAGNLRCAPGATYPAPASRFESGSAALPEAQ